MDYGNFDASPGSAEEKELSAAGTVKDYEDRHYVMPELDPIEVIKLKMKKAD